MKNLSRISIYGLTDVGKVRKANEDCWSERQTSNGHVIVVCDGMGGHANGALASQLAVQHIMDYCDRVQQANPIILLHEAIRFANAQIHGHAAVNPEFRGMGTTCVVVLVTDDGKAYYAHVGDSRLYLFENGKLNRITRDHSLVQVLVDTGQIRPEDADTHPKRNQILKALGTEEMVTPDVCLMPIVPVRSSILLMCSDGLCGMIRDAEIQKILQSGVSVGFDAANKQLVDAALAAGGTDNITSVLIGFPNAGADHKDAVQRSGRTPGWLLILFFLGLILVNGAGWYFSGYRSANQISDTKPDDSVTKVPVVPADNTDQEADPQPLVPIDSSAVFLDSAHAVADRKEWRRSRGLLIRVTDPQVKASSDFMDLKQRVDREIVILDSAFLQSQFKKARVLTDEGKRTESQKILESIGRNKLLSKWAADSLAAAKKRLERLTSKEQQP